MAFTSSAPGKLSQAVRSRASLTTVTSTFLTAFLFTLAAHGSAVAQDLARGESLYALCGTCHGDAGEGNETLGSPAIAGLAPWYLESQIVNFQKGIRGYDPTDTRGLQMRPMARSLTSDADVKSVAAFIAALPAVRAAATLSGDAERGKALYAPCLACHGADGAGNEALKSPGLSHQQDWYIVSQLEKFRSGMRGAHKEDTSGMQMRPMSLVLPDEQALADVAAYATTLGE